MPRAILDESKIHPAVRSKIAGWQQSLVHDAQKIIEQHAVVVIGMGLNPFPKKARRALDAIQQPYQYLEYGNYFNQWRERNAFKLWTGWPTFPMVFVKGVLIGGADDLKNLIDTGELKKMLA
jgi:monothiol glutaredoxin